jgi:FeS assembly SUF system protein
MTMNNNNEMETEKNFLELESKIVDVLKNIYDPEIPVSIYELGLIYEISVGENNVAHITMTVTAPNCPEAEFLPVEVHNKVKEIEGITDVDVKMTFDPPWNEDLMSDAAKLELGLL